MRADDGLRPEKSEERPSNSFKTCLTYVTRQVRVALQLSQNIQL